MAVPAPDRSLTHTPRYPATSATFDMALHWNGTKWSQVKTPAPGGTTSGEISTLVDSACISTANCWAAGDYGNLEGSSARSLNQVLHWNGHKWSVRTL